MDIKQHIGNLKTLQNDVVSARRNILTYLEERKTFVPSEQTGRGRRKVSPDEKIALAKKEIKEKMSELNNLQAQSLLPLTSEKEIDMIVKNLEENTGENKGRPPRTDVEVCRDDLHKLVIEKVNYIANKGGDSEEALGKAGVKKIAGLNEKIEIAATGICDITGVDFNDDLISGSIDSATPVEEPVEKPAETSKSVFKNETVSKPVKTRGRPKAKQSEKVEIDYFDTLPEDNAVAATRDYKTKAEKSESNAAAIDGIIAKKQSKTLPDEMKEETQVEAKKAVKTVTKKETVSSDSSTDELIEAYESKIAKLEENLDTLSEVYLELYANYFSLLRSNANVSFEVESKKIAKLKQMDL